MGLIKIKPRAGALVRHEHSMRPLAAEGELVQNSSYWTRRILDGDVIDITLQTETKKPKNEEKELEDIIENNRKSSDKLRG